jgi:plasmid maintenance system antidote protein VapI
MAAKRKGETVTIGERLRDAIYESGLTHYRIGKDTGIGADQVSRFVEGRDIRISTADKLAGYFGLVLKPKRAKRRK